MPRRVTLRYQHFSQLAPADVAPLRASPKALAEFLASQKVARGSIGQYWHAVPFLLNGVVHDPDEPWSLFREGGETLGKNDVGDVRYITPAQVARLAEVLQETEPDELGNAGDFDEERLQRHKIYPASWLGSDYDQLGQMRELYSYFRDFVADSSKAKAGAVIHFTEESFEMDDPEPEPAKPPAESDVRPTGEVILTGTVGREYIRSDGSLHPQAHLEELGQRSKTMEALGFSQIGDFHPPDSGADTMRAWISKDRTVVALLYFSKRGIGGYIFYSRLEDGLVAASGAFIIEARKRGFFADFVQNAPPDKLLAAVLARRANLTKKHGAPVAFDPTLTVAAGLWEEQRVRLSGNVS